MKQNVLITLAILMQFASLAICQRVAPGVNPNHYQQQQQQYQPPPPQYQQQVPQQQQPQYHQQQQPQQQQPQYQQQQQFQQPQQQQPQHQQHHGEHGQQQVLHTGNLQQEKQHIAEHMEVPIDTSKMSEQELQFHYFKMHDSDNNNKLDGCELIKSLIHWHEQGKAQENSGHPQHEEKIFSNDELSALIDPILNSDDHNQDGFIDYPEFDKTGHHEEQAPRPEYTDEQLEDIVDSVLRMMDMNNDGVIDYAEYRMSGKDNGDAEHHHDPVAYTDEQLSAIVDAVMKNMDRNNDDNNDEHVDGEKPSEGPAESHNEAQPYDDATLQSLIDPIMEMMDKDHDGFITYTEYRQNENAHAP
uniref:EF-hand domain-containing protein n=1 Tax=Anopheles epiroticus TaxID=199890 RepID=A0A182PSR7_9DIPT